MIFKLQRQYMISKQAKQNYKICSWVTKQKKPHQLHGIFHCAERDRWLLNCFVKAWFQGFLLSTYLLILATQDLVALLVPEMQLPSMLCPEVQSSHSTHPQPFNISQVRHSSLNLKMLVQILWVMLLNTFAAKLRLGLKRWYQVAH